VRITQEVIATIAALEDRRGRLTPEQIVDEARPENSILHSCFEWDDAKAGESWRIEQARELIKRVKIVVEIEEKKVRVVAYVRDSGKEATEPGYISLLRVTKPGARETMAEELDRIGELLTRAHGIALVTHDELPRLFAEKIESVNREVKELQATL